MRLCWDFADMVTIYGPLERSISSVQWLKFCFKSIPQGWAMEDFANQDGAIFYKIFKIFVVINQKLCDVCVQKLEWGWAPYVGTTKTPSFIKIQELTQKYSLFIWHGMIYIHTQTHFWYNNFKKKKQNWCVHRLDVGTPGLKINKYNCDSLKR